jgi:YjbE family integral membrane protein
VLEISLLSGHVLAHGTVAVTAGFQCAVASHPIRPDIFPSEPIWKGLPPMEIFTSAGFTALLQVIAIDLVLAGDNAIVIGLAAAGLPAAQRKRAILIGVVAATVLRILFAAITVKLLAIVGLLLAGGILLLWVCWKMWRELRTSHAEEEEATEALSNADLNNDSAVAGRAPKKTLMQAAIQIVIADVSMSLDNVLAVAGAARDHFSVLVIGLVLSIALMGLAASFIAKLLHRHRWIAYVGLLIILYVALDMVYRGAMEVWPFVDDAVSWLSLPVPVFA